jgi:lipopolysaccharide heptosyltransferase II
VFPHLHIYNRWERMVVGVGDWAFAGVAVLERLFRRDALGLPPRRYVPPPKRILLLRLERIGDLLMTLDAIAAVRSLAPQSEIDLVVGSWNRGIAEAIPHVNGVITLDLPWMARESEGLQLAALVRRAEEWAPRNYDVAINFEGDARSHFLMWRSRAPVRIGFDMAGGGPLLTHPVRFDPTRHTAENALTLVAVAAPLLTAVPVSPLAAQQPGPTVVSLGGSDQRVVSDRSVHVPSQPSLNALLRLPEDAAARAAARLEEEGLGGRPIIGLHAGGGREIKQWPPERFGEAVGRLARETSAAVMLTGAASERALVDRARASLPAGVPVIDLTDSGSLIDLAALLARCRLYVSGDTGPMHLAAAVGTPVVAVFGPSDPRRYAPLVRARRVVQIHDTLPCAPCNMIRLPPERCRGVVPDCLAGLSTQLVYEAVRSLWDEVTPRVEVAP